MTGHTQQALKDYLLPFSCQVHISQTLQLHQSGRKWYGPYQSLHSFLRETSSFARKKILELRETVSFMIGHSHYNIIRCI